VRAVAMRKGGTQLISTGHDRTIRLWDLASGNELAALKGHDSNVWSIALSDDENLVVSGGDDPRLHRWKIDVLSDKNYFVRGGNEFTTLEPAPAAPLFRVTTEANAHSIWNGITKKPLLNLSRGRFVSYDNQRGVWVIHYLRNNDREFVITGCKLDVAGLLSVTGDPQDDAKEAFDRLVIDKFQVTTPAFQGNLIRLYALSPNPNLIAIGDVSTSNINTGPGSRIFVISVSDGAVLATIPLRKGTRDVKITADQKYIVSTAFGAELTVYELQSGREVAHRKMPATAANLDTSPDAKYVATAGDDGIARVWQVDNLEPVMELIGHREVVYGVAFSRDGKTLATASWDSRLKLWDLETREERLTLQGPRTPLWFVSFSHDDRRLFVRYDSENGRSRTLTWEAATDAEAPQFKTDLNKSLKSLTP